MLPPEIIDALKLIGEKLDEAVADRNSQRGAIVETAGAVPAIRNYIKAKHVRVAISMLVCDQLTFDDDWWKAFGRLDRVQFSETAYSIRKGLCGLEDALATAGHE
jgi:hypothetical protein